MATHSSTLAWKIPWTEEHSRLLQSMGSQRVGHDCATSLTHSHIMNEYIDVLRLIIKFPFPYVPRLVTLLRYHNSLIKVEL